MGPRAGLDRCGKISPPTGFRSPDSPARSSVAIPTELPGPVAFVVTWYIALCDVKDSVRNFWPELYFEIRDARSKRLFVVYFLF